MNTKANTWTSDTSWRSVDYIASLLQWGWRNYILIYQAHQCRRVNRSSIQSCCSTLLRLMSPWDFPPLPETATSSKVSNRYRMDSFHHRILILITPKWTDFFFREMVTRVGSEPLATHQQYFDLYNQKFSFTLEYIFTY